MSVPDQQENSGNKISELKNRYKKMAKAGGRKHLLSTRQMVFAVAPQMLNLLKNGFSHQELLEEFSDCLGREIKEKTLRNYLSEFRVEQGKRKKAQIGDAKGESTSGKRVLHGKATPIFETEIAEKTPPEVKQKPSDTQARLEEIAAQAKKEQQEKEAAEAIEIAEFMADLSKKSKAIAPEHEQKENAPEPSKPEPESKQEPAPEPKPEPQAIVSEQKSNTNVEPKGGKVESKTDPDEPQILRIEPSNEDRIIPPDFDPMGVDPQTEMNIDILFDAIEMLEVELGEERKLTLSREKIMPDKPRLLEWPHWTKDGKWYEPAFAVMETAMPKKYIAGKQERLAKLQERKRTVAE